MRGHGEGGAASEGPPIAITKVVGWWGEAFGDDAVAAIGLPDVEGLASTRGRALLQRPLADHRLMLLVPYRLARPDFRISALL